MLNLWMKAQKKLSLGCPLLDACLKGGLTNNGITEIAGEAGSGKTQLCLQLCFQVQWPESQGGLNGSAVYITSEDLPMKRMYQIGSAYAKSPSVSTDRIFVETASTMEQQRTCFATRLPILLQRAPVKLVVVDSIAALFRTEFESSEYIERSRAIAEQAKMLQDLCTRYGATVVVTNQVTDVFGTINNEAQHVGDIVSGGRLVRPALGLVWSHAIFCRLCISKSSTGCDLDNQSRVGRELSVGFAPHLPEATCPFSITEQGIKGTGAHPLGNSVMHNNMNFLQ